MKPLRLTLALTIWLLISTSAASALEGYLKMDSEDDGSEIKLEEQQAQIDPKPPTWIEGNVFTNEDMYMYSYWQIPPAKKEWKWSIPSYRRTIIKLRPTVVRHWKGYKPEGECNVVTVPQGPGRFKFHMFGRKDGPHGYLERIGVNKNGFPRYRFWFDDIGDPNATSESAENDKQTQTDTSTTETKSENKSESQESQPYVRPSDRPYKE